MLRRLGIVGIVLSGALAAPATASAHGLVGRSDLPIPDYLFAWAASVVLVVSFVGLAMLWPRPRLEHPRERPLLTIPAWVDVLGGALGIALFALVVIAGLIGDQAVPQANLAPTFVYVAFWVGLVPLSVVAGNVFGWLNPWRALARAIAWAIPRESRPRPYPDSWGRWPAVLGLVAFGWLELVYAERDNPRTLAILALLYAAVQLAGMRRYGIERWTERGDAFAVYFALFARLAPLARRGRLIVVRAPLTGLANLRPGTGTVPLLCVMIGVTTFDGASNGAVWKEIGPPLADAFRDAGLPGTLSGEVAGTLGLLASIGLIAGLYRLGVAGVASVDRRRDAHWLAGRFVHTLVPIAFAYAMAHYFSMLVFQGQALGYLASDPLGDGANLFGTGTWSVDYGALSTTAIWYAQAALLVAGHAAGITLAHDRSLVLFRNLRRATQSQYWMLAVMVGYTSLGLWLLSSVST